jgi:hypothetical protein
MGAGETLLSHTQENPRFNLPRQRKKGFYHSGVKYLVTADAIVAQDRVVEVGRR